MPCTMDVNATHMNDYIWEAVVYVPITWIWFFIGVWAWTSFFVHKMACDGIRVVAQ